MRKMMTVNKNCSSVTPISSAVPAKMIMRTDRIPASKAVPTAIALTTFNVFINNGLRLVNNKYYLI
jgi:hypothetical protein